VESPRAECELAVTGVIANESFGAVLNDEGSFTTDNPDQDAMTLDGILQSVDSAQDALTFLCAPPGNGTRFAIDRDGDGVLNAAE
jgi:hypothetical protein